MPAGKGFEFRAAGHIVFGRGRLAEVAPILRGFGRRALVVTGRSTGRVAKLQQLFATGEVELELLHVEREPTLQDARHGAALARRMGASAVIGIGGGSALDLGKAIAALVTNEGDPLDYVEVIGKGRKLERAGLPYVAIPTTAGTGAEVTKNAVLDAPEQRVKVSLRSELMLPRVALIDPELTLSVPPDVTASTGFDALSQVIEPYVSNGANPLTDAVCVEGILRGARSLARAVRHGDDLDAREDMALCSLFGGLALANARLGAVHGFAGPIGGMFGGPHGAICAALLPHVMAVNIAAARRSSTPDAHEISSRFTGVAVLLTGDSAATAEDGADWVAALAAELGVPPLSAYGVMPEHFAAIAGKAAQASSMQGNPVRLTKAQLIEVLGRAV
jgi:alcohol dehydrogenase class IV